MPSRWTNATVDMYFEQLHEHKHWLAFYHTGQLPAPSWFHTTTGIYIVGIGVFGSICNSLLAWSFSFSEKLRSPSNLLIANLALADFGLSSASLPLYAISSFAEQWIFGKAGCDYYAISAGLFGLMSIGTMASIAVDRFFSITKWASWQLTYRAVGLWIAGVWVFSFLLVTPPLFGWSSYILEGVQTSCTFDYLTRQPEDIAFTLLLFIAGFCLPLSIVVVCYALIIVHVLEHRQLMIDAVFGQQEMMLKPRGTKLTQSFSSSSTGDNLRNQRIDPKNDVRAAVTCAMITLLFCFSWLPYACIALLSTFGQSDLVTPYVTTLPGLFAKTSVIYNPIVYAIMNDRFRNEILCLVRLRKKPSLNSTFGQHPPRLNSTGSDQFGRIKRINEIRAKYRTTEIQDTPMDSSQSATGSPLHLSISRRPG